MVDSGYLGATAFLFRYVSDAERDWIRDFGWIQSNRGETFLTPELHASTAGVQAALALPFAPNHRVGPIASAAVTFDGVGLWRARPQFGQVGGGWEVSTNRSIAYGGSMSLT